MVMTMKNLDVDLDSPEKDKTDGFQADGQTKLMDFPDVHVSNSEVTKVKVYVDKREIRSHVAHSLEKLGVEVILRTLEVGDYVVSDRVGIERKTAEDFLSTFLDGRDLFGQISDLARSYRRPLLIIEGEGIYTKRQIHPNAIRGALSTIAIDFGVPVLFTKDEEDTAALISVIAKREQVDSKKEINLHGNKTASTLPEQMEYVVSAISEIGPVVAKNLLRYFGSVERIMTASREELMAVELVGPKTADRIREVVSGEYKG